MNPNHPYHKGPCWKTSLLIFAQLLILAALIIPLLPSSSPDAKSVSSQPAKASDSDNKSFIKWVDFNVTAEAMRHALRLDVDSYNQPIHHNWLELLAYLGARYGGDFSRYKASDLETLVQKIQDGASMEDLTKDLNYYSYYLEAYGAVLGGMVGVYEIEIPDESTGQPV